MSLNPKMNEKRLTKSEEKYKLILDNANDLIIIFNEKFQFEYANKNPLLKLLGYSVEELIAKSGADFIHPDDREKILKPYLDGFEQSEGSVEARIKHKLGHYILVESNGKMFIDKDGKQKVLIITRDITERKRAEKIIIEENKKLIELSKIKSELIMRASHELKTPLSSIYGASQLLLTNFKEQFGEKALGFIEMIYRGSQKLKQLIENILDVSRVESGKLNLNLREENLVDLINDCISDLKYWADKRNIYVKVEVPKEIILEIDKIRIEQVFINLLSNAIKFTPPKGNIYINLIENDNWIEISIKDTGIGLTT